VSALSNPWPSRAERRREQAKARRRVDPACPPELRRQIDAVLASAIAKKRFEFHPTDTVDGVFRREVPAPFAVAAEAGFRLSFDLPEMTPQALARGVIAYSLTRSLN
jgi:hypothetical protein